MDESRKSFPSLPANYVSLAQLQERWLNQQQRKQREKEEEEQKRREEEERRKREKKKAQEQQREKEEEEQKRREEEEQRKVEKKEAQEQQRDENQGNQANGNRRRMSSSSSRRPRWLGKRQNQADRSSKTFEACEPGQELVPVPKHSPIATVMVDSGEQKIGEPNQNNDKKNRKIKNPRAKDRLKGGRSQLIPEGEGKEKIPALIVETIENGKEGVTREIGRNGDALAKNADISALVDPPERLDIGRKLENLSVNSRKQGNARRAMNTVSRHGDGGPRMFSSPKRGKPTETNVVWVRKGENSHVDGNGLRSSGNPVRSGHRRRNLVHLKQKRSSWAE